MQTVEITKDLFWTGVRDRSLRKFDIIMETEFGTTYNSYLLKGKEKTVLFETAKFRFWEEYKKELEGLTDLSEIDYIVVNHTEPDHAGSVESLLDLNPGIKIVGTATAIQFLRDIVNREFYSIAVKENDTLDLGDRTLRFFPLPNLHWPDTMYTYLEEQEVLFTCDSFGSHYSFDGVFLSEVKNEKDYKKALKYYFDNIIGPFKPYMQKALDKIESLNIKMICTGHGPVLDERLDEMKELYREWSTQENPNTKKTVVIPYVSAYGYTKELGEEIARGIKDSGDIDVRMFDMEESEAGIVLEEMSYADGILFGTPTIVGEALKPIWDLLTSMFAGVYQGKQASAFGSYGWSGEGVPHILERLRQLRMHVRDGLMVKFKPGEYDKTDAYTFGYQFGRTLLAEKSVKKQHGPKKLVKCVVCGEIFEAGITICPVCGVGPENFIPVDAEESGFRKESNETFLILGNGAAGLQAAEEIRKRNQTAEIVMITDEPYYPYNRTMLSKSILAHFEVSQMELQPASWYEKQRIRILTEKSVQVLDTKAKEAVFSDDSKIHYDKCIYALGAECSIPPIKGIAADYVISIRRMEDVEKIQRMLPGIKNAVVIGGGVLGLEAAWEISKAKVKVHVVEAADRLMPKQLDQKSSAMLKKQLERQGICIVTGKQAEAVEKHTIILEDGTVLNADLVLVSTGVTPSIDVAVKSGIESKRGVVVNEWMETSVKDIYACGDCTWFEGTNLANWQQALSMGKIAGANAAGDRIRYNRQIPAISFQGAHTALYSIGSVGEEQNCHCATAEFTDLEKENYEKYYFQNGSLCGAILLGDVSKAAKVTIAVENHCEWKELFE